MTSGQRPPGASPTLAALREEYGRSVPEKLRELLAAVHEGSHERARELAHRLSGSAGSYGFTRLGDTAGQLEETLLRLLGEAGNTRVADDLRQDILTRLESAIRAWEEAHRDG